MTVYQVKPDAVPAGPGPLTTAEIAGILTRLDPTALQDAGAAHTQLARELGAVAAHLAREAGTLADHWSGTAANAALAQFQRLHERAATLAAQASRTGATLTWLGTQVLPAFQHPADPAQARQFLTQLTADLIRADTSLPSQMGTAAPVGSTSQAHPMSNAHPESNISHTLLVSHLQSVASTPAPGAPAATASSAPPSVPASPAALPLAASAASLVLPAVALTRVRPGAPLTPATPADPPAAATTAVADAGTAEPAPASSATATSAVAEEVQATPTPLPARPAAPTGRPRRTTTTPAANSAFMPGTAGVATPPSPERLRQSWITEDRNLWGLPDSCVPALIEGA
jgi:uncharacterized protein YukE